MAELKEIFEMVTERTEPDLDAWEQQEQGQRARARRRRTAALGVAAAILLLAGVLAAAVLRGPETTQPASPAPPLHTTTNLVGFDVATGQSHAVAEDVAPFAPAPAPDGTHLAFVRVTDGHPQIFVSSLDGAHARQVTGLPGQTGCTCGATEPTWIDGSTIVFVGVQESGDHRLYLMRLPDGRPELLASPKSGVWDMAPSWSDATGQLVYSQGRWDADTPGSGAIIAIRLDGTNRAPEVLLADVPGGTEPAWNPSGKRLVLQADVPKTFETPDGGTSIYLSGPATSQASAFTESSDATSPAWSPDGSRLAYVDHGVVVVVTVADGTTQELGHGGNPSWSSDGSTVYAWTTG